jgi:hypothetical protein
MKKHIIYNFRLKNSQKLDLNITLTDKHINISTNIEFLGLTIDDKLSWKDHIGNVLKKLSSACYATRSVKPLWWRKL